MTGNPYLYWAIQAISLFNAILLVWLGLTVLLNSDRRRWGIWVAGGGMLLGAAFFYQPFGVVRIRRYRSELGRPCFLVVSRLAFSDYLAFSMVRDHALVCRLLGRPCFAVP